jgi:hypothetical protein
VRFLHEVTIHLQAGSPSRVAGVLRTMVQEGIKMLIKIAIIAVTMIGSSKVKPR